MARTNLKLVLDDLVWPSRQGRTIEEEEEEEEEEDALHPRKPIKSSRSRRLPQRFVASDAAPFLRNR
jgi:hypothetical protein